jgi:hypothetical protein
MKPRKFRLVDRNSPIPVEAEHGELGIELINFPMLNIWNKRDEIKNFKFVAIHFERTGIQIVSEIQVEEIPQNTEIKLEAFDEDYIAESDYIN